ncbi:hypothetical protein [Ferdinandcohnia sp. Marseille-Q9671]
MRFISNFLPFLILILLTIILFTVSWRKARSKKLIPFYLCIAGLIFLFEYVIFVLFKSYEYYPGIFNDSYFDNILGSNISNGFIVPAATIFIAVFNLGFWWILLIILGFAGIEELFLQLTIYRHFWWQTPYTSVGLLINFYLGKWIWRWICYHIDQYKLRIFLLYFVNVALQGTIMFYLVVLTHLFFYHVNWFDNLSRGHIAFITLYFFIDSIFFSLLVVFKSNWLWKGLLIISLTCINLILHSFGILVVSSHWVLALVTLVQIGELFLLMYMQKLLLSDTFV